MSLQFLLDSQAKFQKHMGTNFSSMDAKERASYMKEHGYFVMEEITEMLREMPYHKSWKDYSTWSWEKFLEQEQLQKEELIDAFHFILNLALALGMDEKEIVDMYKEKNKINYLRQEFSELGYVAPKPITTDSSH